MTLSIIVFAFGLVISGIAGLGVLNAQECARRISLTERSNAQHQTAWQEICRKKEDHSVKAPMRA